MTNEKSCFLCGTKCKFQNAGDFDGCWFFCPRCGNFGTTRVLEINTRSEIEERTKAAMLAAERRVRRPGSTYILTDGNSGTRDNIPWIKFDEFLSRFPRSTYEMLDRTLLNLASVTSHPSEVIEVKESDCLLFFSRDAGGQLYMLRQMVQMGWITNLTSVPGSLYIEAKGWQKVDELSRKSDKNFRQAFVAMWFDSSMQEIYDKAIRPAVEQSGKVTCLRIDQLQHNNKICDQIIAEIRRSKYLIADFSGNRGGVYFEAGFAQGLGIPVIWLVREDHLSHVHFDTRQYNHIVYSSAEDLYEKLSNRIQATIDEG